MKKLLFSSLLLMLSFAPARADGNCSCKATSHTYFAVRPQFQIGSPEFESLAYGLRTKKDNGTRHHLGLQGVLFGGKSTNPTNLGKYFAPYCSNEITIDGQIAVNSKNILPTHFNIFSIQFSPYVANQMGAGFTNITTPFFSKISLNPEQSVVGYGFNFQYQFPAESHTFWIGITAPVLHVQNTMGLKETTTTTNLTPGVTFYNVQPIAGQTTNLNQQLHTMTEALVQDDWLYGKIDNKKHKKTELGFIQFQLGQNWVNEDCYYFYPYIGVNLATGNRPNGKFVFEPIAGNGGHFGMLWGANGGFTIWENCHQDLKLSFDTDLVMQYLFAKTHRRSIDLKYKPWSRYIELYADSAQASQAQALANITPPNPAQPALNQAIFLATPGINLLTQNVLVKPGFNYTHNMALSLSHDKCGRGFDVEGGYNFYARQAECVSIKSFQTGAAIKDEFGRGLTNPVRDITANLLLNEASLANLQVNMMLTNAGVANAYNRGIITTDDLDLASAAHPCMISHTVYAALGYHWDNLCYPIIIGAGGSYEFSHKMNTGLDRWLVWGKFGISF